MPYNSRGFNRYENDAFIRAGTIEIIGIEYANAG